MASDPDLEKFIEAVGQHDFLKIFFLDMNGLSKGKTYPARYVKKIVADGGRIYAVSLTLTWNGDTVYTKGYEQWTVANMGMEVIPTTLTSLPWQRGEGKHRVAQVQARLVNLDKTPVAACPRNIAERQLKRLQERGLQLLSGGEFEFRVFKSISGGPDGLPETLTKSVHPYSHVVERDYQPFLFDLEKRLFSLGIDISCFHVEWGRGMVEVVPSPVLGLDQADQAHTIRQVAWDTAEDHHLIASFMTQPTSDDISNSLDYNVSVWKVDEAGQRTTNAFFDASQKDRLSAFARHWIAGLCFHARALTAIFSPTVNCYRRLNEYWHPPTADWGVEDRLKGFRVRNEDESGCLVEIRFLSSAANPHLAIAAAVAAGLDGVDRKMGDQSHKLRENPDILRFPSCLDEALQALEKDKELCEALGKEFIDRFLAVKRKEIEILGPRDLKSANLADLKAEVDMFFHSV